MPKWENECFTSASANCPGQSDKSIISNPVKLTTKVVVHTDTSKNMHLIVCILSYEELNEYNSCSLFEEFTLCLRVMEQHSNV